MNGIQNLVSQMKISHALEIEDYESQLLRIQGKIDNMLDINIKL
jgi:hypothetical protein